MLFLFVTSKICAIWYGYAMLQHFRYFEAWIINNLLLPWEWSAPLQDIAAIWRMTSLGMKGFLHHRLLLKMAHSLNCSLENLSGRMGLVFGSNEGVRHIVYENGCFFLHDLAQCWISFTAMILALYVWRQWAWRNSSWLYLYKGTVDVTSALQL